MKYPYIKYAAYLVHMDAPLDELLSHICPLTKGEVLTEFPNIPRRGSKQASAWVHAMGLKDVALQTDDGLTAYTLWLNPDYRTLMTVISLRQITNPSDFLTNKLHTKISQGAIDIYNDIFGNFTGWNLSDFESYASKLAGTVDGTVIPLCFEDVDLTYLLAKAGIVNRNVDYGSILNEIFVDLYAKYKTTSETREKLSIHSSLMKTYNAISSAKGDSNTEFLQELDRFKLTLEPIRFNHNVESRPQTKEEYEQMILFKKGPPDEGEINNKA